jgi:hypothetical protein
MILQENLRRGQHYRDDDGKEWVITEVHSGGHTHLFLSPEAYDKRDSLVMLPDAGRGTVWRYANLNRMNTDGWEQVPAALLVEEEKQR